MGLVKPLTCPVCKGTGKVESTMLFEDGAK
jgi:hypothetical protein